MFHTVANTPKSRRLSFADGIGSSERNLAATTCNGGMFSPNNKSSGFSTINFKQIEIKPRLLETKITEDENFLKVSDGFKRLFSNDREDQRLVLPISGYGGHRRGDRS